MIEAVAPLRFGQRVAVVGGARSGRTTLLAELARGLRQHQPDLAILALVVAERPEDVTELQRIVPGEVAATTFDEGDVRHLQVADMGIERAKRRVERREDIVVLLDSASRLVRAAAGAVAPSGRAVGGVDVAALQRVKRLLAAGRAVEEGGSLTLIYVVDPADAFAAELLGIETARVVLDAERAAAFRWPTVDPLRSWSAGTEATIDAATRARLATDEGVDALRRA
jgi:transcription termination factor Rho